MTDKLMKAVTKVRVKAKDHSHVCGFSFWSKNLKGDDIPIFETEPGETQDSHETTFELEEGERVVGCYGIRDKAEQI